MSTIIKKLDHHDIYDFISPLKNPKLKEATAGKSIIITGASEGIGRVSPWHIGPILLQKSIDWQLNAQGIAEQFAHAGATTFFLSVRSNTKALQSTADSVKSINPSARVFTQLLDHTRTSDVESLFNTVKQELGGTSADILINNAGIAGHLSDIAHSDVDKWWNSVEVLLKGPYIMTRAFIQSTLNAGNKGGVVIHTSSVGSYYTVKELAAYQIGKIGLNRLSEFIRFGMSHPNRSLRWVAINKDAPIEHEKDNITSFSFHPGGVNTQWWDGLGPTNPLYAGRELLAQDTRESTLPALSTKNHPDWQVEQRLWRVGSPCTSAPPTQRT